MPDGASLRIGAQVHAFLAEDRCAVAWITDWDSERELAFVAGFRRPLEQKFSAQLVFGEEVRHQPSPKEGEGVAGGPLVLSFHMPDECPWQR